MRIVLGRVAMAAGVLATAASAASAAHTIPAARSRPLLSGADWVQYPAVTGRVAGQEDCDRPMLVRQSRSLDGGFLYQKVCRWVTSNDIIQVRLSDGRRREVSPGNGLRVIRTGPWRGYLLLQKHKYIEGGGSYDATWVVRPDGREMLRIPRTDDGDTAPVDEWLANNGWTAD